MLSAFLHVRAEHPGEKGAEYSASPGEGARRNGGPCRRRTGTAQPVAPPGCAGRRTQRGCCLYPYTSKTHCFGRVAGRPRVSGAGRVYVAAYDATESGQSCGVRCGMDTGRRRATAHRARES